METHQQKQKRERAEIFARIHYTVINGIRNVKSDIAQAWLKEKGISHEVTGAGFSSGQISHRKPKEYLDELESVGFIRANNIVSKNGDTGYLVFAKYGIVFPLKDEKGNVVNFYGIRIKLEKEEHSFINEEGIYPAFPHEMTTKLFITTTVIDTATLLEAKVLENRDAVICIPNGKVLKQHEEAIKRLNQLKSVIWIEAKQVDYKVGLKGRVMSKEYLEKTKAEANEGLS